MCDEHTPDDIKNDKVPEADQDLGQFCSLEFGDDLVNGIAEITSLDLKNLPQNPQDVDHVQ